MESPVTELRKRELTMDAHRANMIAVFISIPVLLALAIPFVLANKEVFEITSLKTSLKFWASPPGVIIILAVMALGIALHESIHGLTFSIFARRGLK